MLARFDLEWRMSQDKFVAVEMFVEEDVVVPVGGLLALGMPL